MKTLFRSLVLLPPGLTSSFAADEIPYENV
jgi:hypothetical protein